MRSSILFAILMLGACHKSTGDDTTGVDSDVTEQATFTIRSPDIVLMPNQETTKCYYFHTPNTTTVNVHKWSSHMTVGSHHMIMFFGTASQPADGTINDNCGLGGTVSASNIPVWVYGSQIADQTEELPADDGGGNPAGAPSKPLAQQIPAGQPAYIQMHYLNASDAMETVHVELSAYALDPATPFTRTDAYVTYNGAIRIPAHAQGTVAQEDCTIPAFSKFWTLSTHSHKQSIKTEILDGTTSVFSSTDWEHPGAHNWMAAPFYTFSQATLTFACTYNNIGGTSPPDNSGGMIQDGPSAQTDEMCMATGYYFPSTATKICYCYQHNGCVTL